MTLFNIDMYDAFFVEGFLFGVLTTLLCLLINYFYHEVQKMKHEKTPLKVFSTLNNFIESQRTTKTPTQVARRRWK